MNLRKIMIAALLLLLAVGSVTKVSSWMADPDMFMNKHSIEQTDEKISSVMTLSGGAAATSATLSLLPGDICTPLADQLAELAKYFLLILSALYLEKFLITLSGCITFSCLIPIACLLMCGAILFGKKNLHQLKIKLRWWNLRLKIILGFIYLDSKLILKNQLTMQ